MSDNNDKLPDKPDFSNSDNRDLTIAIQQKQIEDLTKKVSLLEAETTTKTYRILELENIKSKVEEAKKKSQIEQMQGKYFYSKNLKLTWELIVELCSHIMDGFSPAQACTNLGIPERLYEQWKKKATQAKSENDIFYTFFRAVERAKNFEEKRYKSKVDTALFQNDFANYFTDKEIKEMKPEDRLRTLATINKANLDKGRLALDLLRIRKPKKYFQSSLDLTEETIERNVETTTTVNKSESVEQHSMVSKIQQIIKKKTAHVSLFEEEESEDDFEL